MSTKEDHRMGITPITIRRAAYYASLGLGTYCPQHPHFDEVRVTALYDVTQSPHSEMEWAYGTRVEFYQQGKCLRFVEWSSRLVGAGGMDILRKVEEDV